MAQSGGGRGNREDDPGDRGSRRLIGLALSSLGQQGPDLPQAPRGRGRRRERNPVPSFHHVGRGRGPDGGRGGGERGESSRQAGGGPMAVTSPSSVAASSSTTPPAHGVSTLRQQAPDLLQGRERSPVPSFHHGVRGGGRNGGRGRGGGPMAVTTPASVAASSSTTPPAHGISTLGQQAPDLLQGRERSLVPSFHHGGRGSGSNGGRGHGGGPMAVTTPTSVAASSSTMPPTDGASSSSSAEISEELTSVDMPTRPGYGIEGKKCTVRANHFLVELTVKHLHRYKVTISPETKSKRIFRNVLSRLVDVYRISHLDELNPVYDGTNILYTAGPLPFQSKEFRVNLLPNDDSSKKRQFEVAIEFKETVDVQHLLSGSQLNEQQKAIQALAIVLTTSVGRSFFSSKEQTIWLGGGLECRNGFCQSLRRTQMGLSLNVDSLATTFYEPILVNIFVQKNFGLTGKRVLSDQEHAEVEKALIGIKVKLLHRPKVYKTITGLSDLSLRELKCLRDGGGKQRSVVRYFQEQYHRTLQYTFFPAIECGTGATLSYFPMEVCEIVERQRYSKILSATQVRELLCVGCRPPSDREKRIQEIVSGSKDISDGLAQEFGIEVSKGLTLVDARVLLPPQLKYRDCGEVKTVSPHLGKWNMKNLQMINGGRVASWACVTFSKLPLKQATEFCRQLIDVCIRKGMKIPSIPATPTSSADPEKIKETLIELHKAQLQLLIVILPEKRGFHGIIKRICETKLGIVSQCCQHEKASRPNRLYLESLALKINVKVGGQNSVLLDDALPMVRDCHTIIFGADVTHPNSKFEASIAAVVASMDWPNVSKYRALVSAQDPWEEIIQDLCKVPSDPAGVDKDTGLIQELINSFAHNNNRHLPERIIFYRDGVGEGQFSQVLLHEVNAIRRACRLIGKNYKPRVTFIVVQKRNRTRFFPTDTNNRDRRDRSGNVDPGTVVDSFICHPTEFDFYLNSHAAIKGTSRPVHYHVLFDENKFTADQLQVLTNNLCYTYARCTRSVSIVPPVYYAHLAASRARCYTEGETSGATGGNSVVQPLPSIADNVKDVMFFC